MTDENNVTLVESKFEQNKDARENAKVASLESLEQKMAYEIYYKMGEERSLAKVAKQMNKAKITIEGWSRKFRWSSRVREQEKTAAEFLLLQQSAQQEAETKNKHLTLIDAAIGQFSRKLVDEKITIKSIDDLERLVNLRWKVANIPERIVNQTALGGSGGATIDLRLRNMEKPQLQKYIHTTLASLDRIMNRERIDDKKLLGEGEKLVKKEPPKQEKVSMDIRIETNPESPPADNDLNPNDYDVLDLDFEENDPK
jgi:hypothetical protein